MSELYRVEDLGKTVCGPAGELTILSGLNLRVDAGESCICWALWTPPLAAWYILKVVLSAA